ncbi:DsbA family protein [Microbacterium halophytorum]|uniref:DsbA family protein n=1 Tax=Microbacterium halophytorum TaxID=2067568 RepID=UPI000CFCBE0E|nr:thioredoxin domain-containing protein [Microbacterium halophytorum]
MAAAARRVNWLVIWITAAIVVVVVAIAAIAIWMNRQALALAESPASAVVNEETGAIALGEGENVIDEYVDFMCPFCGQFHDSSGEDLSAAVESGEITLNLHPISILDGQSQGTNYSTRAANAVYCVADDNPDAVYPFYDALFQNQPGEGTTGLDDGELLDLAERAGASGDVESCIADGTYFDFVAARTQEIPPNPQTNQVSTPTVTRNGEYVNLTLDQATDEQALLG